MKKGSVQNMVHFVIYDTLIIIQVKGIVTKIKKL